MGRAHSIHHGSLVVCMLGSHVIPKVPLRRGQTLPKGECPALQSTFLTVISLHFVLFLHFTDEASSAQRGQNSGPTKVTQPVKGEVETDSQAFGCRSQVLSHTFEATFLFHCDLLLHFRDPSAGNSVGAQIPG